MCADTVYVDNEAIKSVFIPPQHVQSEHLMPE